MTRIYEEEDYVKALKLKRTLLYIYFGVLAVFLAVNVVFFVMFLQLPYQSNDEIIRQKNIYYWIICGSDMVFAVFSFIYLGIPFKRARYYFRMLDDIKTGQKQKSESTFLQNDMSVTEVGNVDFHTMVVLEWSDKTQEYMRRNVLVDKEKPMPKLKNGDIIVYTTHANVLLSYGLKSEETVFETE
ncbi:MAG: hypothetical protein J6N93_02365 [Clostridia bacterium]|nr:hypothetical protein [Clostridia bacterium]